MMEFDNGAMKLLKLGMRDLDEDRILVRPTSERYLFPAPIVAGDKWMHEAGD
jgi:hypothetical protein